MPSGAIGANPDAMSVKNMQPRLREPDPEGFARLQ